ncbi:hypothetical protein HFN78_35680 [Rhizobium laguerreae]|uniref:hypothetical protein n=1 Tax=Rhizobium laguerreae TaxID=1076926 RepID=UPI001C90E240|nr:hypothetical protein [Rhizobium laguerreae]MBY3476170.1 hypothetical protein [Rhizobium laguerreae]MBY3521861.1 hypothetical protein [Rhizobium laguerreae]
MLIAVTSNKSGRLPDNLKPGSSWREAFRQSEDLLTAAAFGRLTYLEGGVLWSVLRSACGNALPDFRFAELVAADFWPWWSAAGGEGRVQPDVVLGFSVGDPAIRIDIIVEAKLRPHSAQSARQWRGQWESYHEANGELPMADAVYLMAIGGLGVDADRTAEKLIKQNGDDGVEIKAVAASWDQMLNAVHARIGVSKIVPEKRILSDIIEAIALAGYRRLTLLDSLPSLPLHGVGRSMGALLDYDFGGYE